MFNVFLNQYPLVCKKKSKRRHEKKKSKWSTRPYIDRVFAKELESGDSNQFEFWGRLQTNSNLFDKLTTLWMDENRMGVEFRENLKRKPGMLFELPVETRNLTPVCIPNVVMDLTIVSAPCQFWRIQHYFFPDHSAELCRTI